MFFDVLTKYSLCATLQMKLLFKKSTRIATFMRRSSVSFKGMTRRRSCDDIQVDCLPLLCKRLRS
jgi:hypothetical protein